MHYCDVQQKIDSSNNPGTRHRLTKFYQTRGLLAEERRPLQFAFRKLLSKHNRCATEWNSNSLLYVEGVSNVSNMCDLQQNRRAGLILVCGDANQNYLEP